MTSQGYPPLTDFTTGSLRLLAEAGRHLGKCDDLTGAVSRALTALLGEVGDGLLLEWAPPHRTRFGEAIHVGEGRPALVGAAGRVLEDGRAHRSDAVLAVPVRVDGRTAGALAIGRWGRDWPTRSDDEVLAAELAARIGAAVEMKQLIDAERAALDEARAAQQLVDALFRHAPVGLAVLDERQRYLAINDTLASMNGHPAAAHHGRSVEDLLPTLAPSIVPALRQVSEQNLVIRGLEVSAPVPETGPEIRHWHVTYFPIPRLAQPSLVGGAVVEITDQKRATEMFQGAVDSMLDCFGIYRAVRDPAGAIVDFTVEYVNEAACVSDGMSREAQIGRRLLTLLPAHERTGLLEPYARVVDSGEPLVSRAVQYRDRCDGVERDRTLDIRAVKLGDGVAVCWRDVSEEHRSVLALERMEQRLTLAVESARAVAWEWDTATGQVWRSRSAPAVMGVPTSEIVVPAQFLACIHPDDRSELETLIAAPGEVARDFSLRYRWRRPDTGEELWIQDRGRVLPGGGPAPTVLGVALDVTEIVRARAEADVRRRQFEAVVDNTPDVISRFDPELRHLYVNPAGRRLTGLALEALIGRTNRELGHPTEFLEVWEPALRRTFETGTPQAREFSYATPSGVAHFNVRVVPEFDAEGRVETVLAVSRDITALRQAEAEARHAQSLDVVGKLAGGVAHEINNQLTSVLGFQALASKHPSMPAEAAEDIQMAHQGAERAAMITRQLLAIGRRSMLRPRTFELFGVLEESVVMLRRLVDPGIDVRLEREGAGGWLVHMDRDQLVQVLLNLALNARDAMPTGGVLTFSMSHEAALSAAGQPVRFGHVRVTDTGHGMAPEVLSQALQPFFTTKPFGQGTGLGLSVAHGVINQSGGSLWIESEPELGTTVHLHLPLVAPAPGGERSAGGSSPDAAPTVLVVDDEPTIRKIAERILTDEGWHTKMAANGAEALQIIAEDPSLVAVVTDIMMPGINGIELGRRIGREWGIPLLYISAYPMEELGLDLGPDAVCLQKPFDPAALVAGLRRICRPAT